MLCCSRDGRHLCTIRGICATPMGVLASSPLLAARVTSSESPRCAGVRVLFCYAVSFVRALGAYLYGSLFSSPCRNIGVSAVLSGRVDVVSRVVPLCKLVHSAQRCAQTCTNHKKPDPAARSARFGVLEFDGFRIPRVVHGYHNFRFHATGAATRAHARAPLRLTRPSLPAPPRWLVPLGPALALPQAEARLPHPAGAGTRRCQ